MLVIKYLLIENNIMLKGHNNKKIALIIKKKIRNKLK